MRHLLGFVQRVTTTKYYLVVLFLFYTLGRAVNELFSDWSLHEDKKRIEP